MPLMIPDIPLDSITNAGEREVYRQLREQLQNNWVVRYKFPVCWLDGQFLRDCECDFIVLVPDHGLLLLEVKGSHGYDCQGGTWYRIKNDGSREPTRNPFEQAMATKHRIVERIAQKVLHVTKTDFPGLFGHVVVYPFGRVEGALPNSTEPTLMIAYKDMSSIKDRLEHAFAVWGPEWRGKMFTPSVMTKVKKFFADETRLVTVLSSAVDEDERKIEELTQRQFAAFRGILGNPRVHVRGTAGSGKTIIAAWAAQALAESGEKVLLICFNRVLAAWLRNRQGPKRAFEIRSFFSLCHEALTKAQITFTVPETETEQRLFWTTKAPAFFCEALERVSEKLLPRYDAIIVDEAQDFHQDWWFPVQLLLRDPDNGRLCLFSDPEQSGVYRQGEAFPSNTVSFDLIENCRNTKCITSYCGKVLNRLVTPFYASPIGVKPQVLDAVTDARERAQVVRRIVIGLLGEQFAPSRIALLSPWRTSSPESALNYLPMIHGKSVQGEEENIPAWNRGMLLWASTIRSFKGLEADCIILADAPVPSSLGFSLTDIYVAASRAKHRLFIVPTSIEAAKQLRSWAFDIK